MSINANPLYEARESYSSEWANTSNFFQNKGYYNWCAENINEYSKVLEIGVGIGNSSLNLLKRRCKIIGIEENNYNINKAIELLRLHKIFCGKLIRENAIEIENGKYHIDYSEIAGIPKEMLEQHEALIIQGDFILDEPLKRWLCENEKFDVVVCWFAGIHGIIYKNLFYSLENPAEYRIHLHDFLFQFGPRLLKPNGVINICDRFRHFDAVTEKTLLAEMRKAYKFQERQLEIKSINKITIGSIDTIDGIQHLTHSGQKDEELNTLCSITVGLTGRGE